MQGEEGEGGGQLLIWKGPCLYVPRFLGTPPPRSNDTGWTDALCPPKVEMGWRGQRSGGKVGEEDGSEGLAAQVTQRGCWSGWGEEAPPATQSLVGRGEPQGRVFQGKLKGVPSSLLVGGVAWGAGFSPH